MLEPADLFPVVSDACHQVHQGLGRIDLNPHRQGVDVQAGVFLAVWNEMPDRHRGAEKDVGATGIMAEQDRPGPHEKGVQGQTVFPADLFDFTGGLLRQPGLVQAGGQGYGMLLPPGFRQGAFLSPERKYHGLGKPLELTGPEIHVRSVRPAVQPGDIGHEGPGRLELETGVLVRGKQVS